MDHQNSNDSRQLYVTLSHLAYFRSVWDKRETNSYPIDKQDFLSEPKLFHALLEVFVAGLKHFDSLDSAQYARSRHTVVACLNGLSQLLLRRSSKLTPATTTAIIRVVWSHIAVLSCQCLPPALCSSNPSISSSQSDSCSDLSSSGLSSSEDNSRPVEPEVQRDTHDIAHFTAPVKNSSSQDVSHVFHPFSSDVDLGSRRTTTDAMESIASGLLIAAGPPATETLGGTSCTSTRTSHTKRVRGRFVNPDPPVIKSSVRRCPNSQLKAYALAVFCTRRLLDTCRAQITLDVWPTLMCGEQSHSLSASHLRGQLHEALLGCCLTTPYDVSGADRSNNLPPSADLLSLIHRTADKGIRQMLIDILIYLLSSVGRRFVMAEDLTPHSGSFVPYSVRLAVELRHLHRRILVALSNETRLGLQALLLKALTTLVHITPYQRLQPGLLTSLLPALRQLLHRTSADTRVVDLRAGCLNLLANIVGKVPGPLLEVCQILSPAVQSDSDEIQASAHPRSTCQPGAGLSSASVHPSANQFRPPNCWSPTHSRDTFTPCWLVQVCLRLIYPDVSSFAWDSRYSESIADTLSPDQPLQVRIQALSVLREMVPSYAGFLRPSLPVIQKTLLFCLKDLPENKPLWGATLRFLDVFLPHLSNATNEGPDGSVHVYDDCVLTSWWENFVPPILRILQCSDDTSDRLWCCRLFSAWTERVVSLLNKEELEKSLFSRIILSLKSTSESEIEICSSRAIRTLAALLPFTPLSENLGLCCYILVSAERLWERAQGFAAGLDIASALAGALEIVVIREESAQNGNHPTSWMDISERMRENGVVWPKVMLICCDLTSPDSSKFSKATGQTVANQTNVSYSDPEQVRNPDARRCEYGSKALGYIFRLLSPGLLDRAETLDMIIRSMCTAMTTDKVCSSEKIRWNANYAASHLFRNQYLWSQLADPMVASTDPILSTEAVRLYGMVAEHLVQTFSKDRYFKARSYAANSLLCLFQQPKHQRQAESNRQQQLVEPVNLLKILNSARMTDQCSLKQTLEWSILDASFDVLGNVEECEFETSSSSGQFEPKLEGLFPPVTHLSESQYRQQCVHSSVVLIFCSLTTLLSIALTRTEHSNNITDWASELNTLLGGWLTENIRKKLMSLVDKLHSTPEYQLSVSNPNECGAVTADLSPILCSFGDSIRLFDVSDRVSRLRLVVQLFQSQASIFLQTLDSLIQSFPMQHFSFLCSILSPPTHSSPVQFYGRSPFKKSISSQTQITQDNTYAFRQIYD
ncbi:hypothetical protein CRM22_007049 [Opisthorchis felineus]|uniref:DUF4042 domain-containing protein n=1 Tax=Opisthorchis felineus TaxID=147828 RepID=A0A4S2LQG8_OPIFE|nr:hypothetical protein CRM22_007049 [Opisthorchis felineus]